MKKTINGSLMFLLLSMLVVCTDEKDVYTKIHPNLLPSEGHSIRSKPSVKKLHLIY